MRKRYRQLEAAAKGADVRSRGTLKYAAMVVLALLGVALVFGLTSRPAASSAAQQATNSFAWTGQGSDACARGTTGNMLWIFNPHSDAVPVSLTVTWSTGQTDTYTGWTESGQGQDWHLTVDIVGGFPPQSASVAYTGTLGNNPVLTISGCNESITTGTTTTGTTTTGTTTTGTTQTSTTGTTETTGTTQTVTTTTPGTTVTTTTPGTTVTTTTPGSTTTTPGGTTTVTHTVTTPPQTVTQTTTVGQTTPGPTKTVTTTVTLPGKTKVIVRKKVIVHVKKVQVPRHPHFAYTR